MGVRKLAVIVCLSMLWTGCTSIDKEVPNEKWQNFNSNSVVTTHRLPDDRTMVVFIREPNVVSGPAVNVFVEGQYLTSLQAGGFKAVSMCATSTNINTAYTDSKLNYSNLRVENQPYDLSRSPIHYFAVIQSEDSQLKLESLTEQQAYTAMQNTREQVNTLSRLEDKSVCPKVDNQLETPQLIVKKYTLSANALFAYGKTDSQHVLAQGHDQIAVIAAEIVKNTDNIGQIGVIGYSDPVGSDAYNQNLSWQRAETVRTLLIKQGVTNPSILVEGRGERDLVVSDCEKRFAKNKAARDECNSPNRRVEIVTYSFKAQ